MKDERMDEKALIERTRRTAERLFGPPKPGEGAFALWRSFDPEVAKHMSLFFTGRLYAREVISQKQRELCAVAALTVTNMQHELYIHANAALNVGATPKEVAEVIFQMQTYGGVPCTVEGLKTLKAVLEERGEWRPAPLPSKPVGGKADGKGAGKSGGKSGRKGGKGRA